MTVHPGAAVLPDHDSGAAGRAEVPKPAPSPRPAQRRGWEGGTWPGWSTDCDLQIGSSTETSGSRAQCEVERSSMASQRLRLRTCACGLLTLKSLCFFLRHRDALGVTWVSPTSVSSLSLGASKRSHTRLLCNLCWNSDLFRHS